MKAMIEAKHICKSYGDVGENKLVLKDVSFDMKQGEFLTIMGPSGSGKSTLLYSTSCMDFIDSGEVFLRGKLISNGTEKELAKLRRSKMGFIFQEPSLCKNLNVIDNIVLTTMLANRKEREQIKERARELLVRTGIIELETRDVKEASGGQLQRVGICRALMNHPDIIFGDEPTGALNSKSADEILEILGEVHERGTSLMIVTHDAKVAAHSERVLFMVDGEITSELILGKYDRKTKELGTRMELVTKRMTQLSI